MRIGIVTGEYPPMQGGVGAYTRELARALVDRGNTVDVFTRRVAGPSRNAGIATAPVVGKKWGWGTIPQIGRWAQQTGLEVLNIQFQTAAYGMHPSIHLLPGLLGTGIPTVTTFHDLRVPYLFAKAGPLRERIVHHLAKSSAAVIATDHADENRLVGEWHVPCVRCIPIGSNIIPIPFTAVERDETRAELGIRSDQPLISYFGFLNQSKGGLTLIHTLALLVQSGVDAHLVMIGGRAGASDATNQEYGRRVDEAIAAHGLTDRVHWSGFVDDAMVSRLLYASDITCLPYVDGASLRRGTLMAALAHGRAILTTTPVSSELDGVVEAVAPDDPPALSAAIHSLWDTPARRAALERAAVAAAGQFTWPAIARATHEFFQEFLDR